MRLNILPHLNQKNKGFRPILLPKYLDRSKIIFTFVLLLIKPLKMDTTNLEVVATVYRTKDYLLFKQHEENRELIPSHVKKIYKSMMKSGWIQGSLVIMGDDDKIRDGHHRVASAQMADVPIDFVIINNPMKDLISQLNMNRKLWSFLSHLDTYIKRGNSNYIDLAKFMNEYSEFTPTDCMMMCKNSSRGAYREEFETGSFIIKDIDVARTWGDQLRTIKPFFEEGYCRGPFVRALIRAMVVYKDVFNFDEFFKRLKSRARLAKHGAPVIKPHQTNKQYSLIIEDIYNHKRAKKIYLK